MQDSAAIIFEDPSIAVCLKPAGLLSQAGEGESMLSLLDRHFAENGEKAKAYPVHRLDRETGGLMVYAKDSRSAAGVRHITSFCRRPTCEKLLTGFSTVLLPTDSTALIYIMSRL